MKKIPVHALIDILQQEVPPDFMVDAHELRLFDAPGDNHRGYIDTTDEPHYVPGEIKRAQTEGEGDSNG